MKICKCFALGEKRNFFTFPLLMASGRPGKSCSIGCTKFWLSINKSLCYLTPCKVGTYSTSTYMIWCRSHCCKLIEALQIVNVLWLPCWASGRVWNFYAANFSSSHSLWSLVIYSRRVGLQRLQLLSSLQVSSPFKSVFYSCQYPAFCLKALVIPNKAKDACYNN